MARVKLGDVAKEYKKNIKDNANLPSVGLEHLTPCEIELERWDEKTENTFTKGFKAGHMLFGRRRAYLKKAALAPFDGICSGDIIVIEAMGDKLNPELLPFIVQNDWLFDFAMSKSAGGLSPRVKWNDLKEFEFELPSMDRQDELVDLLKAAYQAKRSYTKLISATNELVKSQFIEMFGDPLDNPMNWLIKPLKEITTKLGSGATPKGGNASYKDEGISLIRSMHVYNGRFDYEDLAHIDEEQAKRLDNVTVNREDVLLNITGASVARCCIVPDDILPARVNQHVCIIRCKQEEVLPVFINHMFIGDAYQAYLWAMAEAAGATRQALTKEQIENLQILVPPLERQREFIRFAEQSDKSKFELQKSIKATEQLMKSLLQSGIRD